MKVKERTKDEGRDKWNWRERWNCESLWFSVSIELKHEQRAVYLADGCLVHQFVNQDDISGVKVTRYDMRHQIWQSHEIAVLKETPVSLCIFKIYSRRSHDTHLVSCHTRQILNVEWNQHTELASDITAKVYVAWFGRIRCVGCAILDMPTYSIIFLKKEVAVNDDMILYYHNRTSMA